MPNRPKKPCAYTRCKELTTERFCEEHRKLMHRDYKNKRTDYDEQSFYKSTAWRKVRHLKLSMQPLCEECERNSKLVVAEIVDHIKPIKRGGARLDMSNLQSLCRACHNKKTANE